MAEGKRSPGRRRSSGSDGNKSPGKSGDVLDTILAPFVTLGKGIGRLLEDVMHDLDTKDHQQRFVEVFGLEEDELLVTDYACAVYHKVLLQGRLYVSLNFVCFYSNIFGKETLERIPLISIRSMSKKKTIGIVPNAIEIATEERVYFFTSFIDRDAAYRTLDLVWRKAVQASASAKASSKPPPSSLALKIAEANRQHDSPLFEVIDAELRDPVNAIAPEDIEQIVREDYVELEVKRQHEAQKLSDDSPVRVERPAGGSGRSKGKGKGKGKVKEERAATTDEVDDGAATGAAAAAEIRTIEVSDVEFPGFMAVEEMKLVETIRVSATPQQVFSHMLADNAPGYLMLRELNKDTNVSIGSWKRCRSHADVMTRRVAFTTPIDSKIGPSSGPVHQDEFYQWSDDMKRLRHSYASFVEEVPYSDHFHVVSLVDLAVDPANAAVCIVKVYYRAVFTKKTIFRGTIMSGVDRQAVKSAQDFRKVITSTPV